MKQPNVSAGWNDNPAFFVLLRRAFLSSLPVLMGYVTMGFAAGVLLAANSGVVMPWLFGFLSSAIAVSGTLQFMLVDWTRTHMPLLSVAMLTICLNLRYAMYGLSLIERFRGIPLWQRCYLIWTLTDETYALETECRLPVKKQNILYCLLLSAMNHSYWVIGVTAGAIAGTALPFSNEGIDFAMTALFLVILTDQCREKQNRLPACVGIGASLAGFLLFGAKNMLIPSMILMFAVFLIFRKKLDPEWKQEKTV